MRIERVTLREIRMPLAMRFETSFGTTTERRILLAEVKADGVTGWGECVADEKPYYSPENIDTAWLITRDFLWPDLRGREFGAAKDVWSMLGHTRGHNMAKAALESAIWDAEAKQKNIPLWKLLGGTRQEIASGVSIGIQSSPEELAATVEKELAAGYQRIKVKIKPGKDVKFVETIRKRWPQIRLMADANSAYTLEDVPMLKQLDEFGLMMIEQPLGWDDIYSHVKLQRQLKTPICLDECIHEYEHAVAAIETDACKIINMKMGRVGGHSVMRKIHDLCLRSGIPMWCGGMLETGIGRAQNIALSTLENFTLPGDVAAGKRYWKEDIVEPEIEVTARGTIKVPNGPGIGYEPILQRIQKVTVRSEVLA
ncbi:MAG TPA: o-succinylbenzoate synthase [Candidatus Acidoferrales bacterium]|nr:o-succinylbenzoate synthase [Candidatus Acidoferrales bacterium]